MEKKINNIDTIVALANTKTMQTFYIIRLSGPKTLEIMSNIFSGKFGKNRKLTFGNIVDKKNNLIVDEVLVSWFTKTNNFLGGYNCEIYTHGNIYIIDQVMDLIVANGARLANPGEFTRRSFLHNKIKLNRAELINTLIYSKNKAKLKISQNKLNRESDRLIKKLIFSLEKIEKSFLKNNKLSSYYWIKLKKISSILNEVVITSTIGQKILNGINLYFLGNQNKKSILKFFKSKKLEIKKTKNTKLKDLDEKQYIFENIVKNFKNSFIIDSFDKLKYNKNKMNIITSKVKNFNNENFLFIENINNDIKSLVDYVIKELLKSFKFINKNLFIQKRHLKLIKSSKEDIKKLLINKKNIYNLIKNSKEKLQQIFGINYTKKLLKEVFSPFGYGG